MSWSVANLLVYKDKSRGKARKNEKRRSKVQEAPIYD
jgi:hypothetical protein